MIVPRGYCLERPEGGYRACAPEIPGCVVILRDKHKAAELVSIAVAALIEEQEEKEKLQ